MKIIKGNIWNFHPENYVVVPTNGVVKRDGLAVMGLGMALQAATKFPELARKLGHFINTHGNKTVVWSDYNLITLPTKNHYSENSDLSLIEQSLKDLQQLWKHRGECLYVPLIGTGLGRLNWDSVQPLVEQYLGDKAVVVIYER